MTRLARALGRLVRIGALALIATLAVPTAAHAATPVPVVFDCQARSPFGGQQITLDTSVQTTAPSTVAPGGALVIVLAPDPLTVPAKAGAYPVQRISGLALKFPVPAGTAYQGAKLLGGSGLGNAQPTVSQANGVVTLLVPGPIAGGATFQLPAVHLALRVTGAAGTTITSRVSGTAYTNPGLLFAATVKVGPFPFDAPVFCFPNPSPTLTSTAIA